MLLALLLPAPALAEGCPNEAFRVGPSAHLPDCRAYELVSPPFKGGGHVELFAVNPDGASGLLKTTSTFADVEGFPELSLEGPAAFYPVQRTTAGWVAPKASSLPASEYLPFLEAGFLSFSGVAGDASTTFWFARGPGRPENSIDIYRRAGGGAIADIGPALPPTSPFGFEIDQLGSQSRLEKVGNSTDGSHVFFSLNKDLWPFDRTAGNFSSLYEYAGQGGSAPLLVGVDNQGNQISQCGTVIGGGETASTEDGLPAVAHNAISSDGQTVFFTAFPRSPGCLGSAPAVNEVLARIDNGQPSAHTVAISEPSAEDCTSCDTEAASLAPALFEGASEDGSKTFFATRQPLLGGDASENIYEFDFGAPAGQRVIRVSGGDETVSDPVANVVGHPQISEDGSHVYFIARGVLTTAPNVFGQVAQPGANNLYVFERDAAAPAGHIAFIAALSADAAENLWTGGTSGGTNLTPEGRFFLFTSSTDLTPDDTSGAQQLFEYDASTGSLVRISVGQDGFNDDGNAPANGGDAEIVIPRYEGVQVKDEYASRKSLTANGDVFFQSSVGLTPEALNRKVVGEGESHRAVYAMNVYEYHDGVVSLISDGRDLTSISGTGISQGRSNVRLVGTDESGEDVFFESGDQLVSQDIDTNVDVYDARVNGGFAPPPAPARCSGEACQGQLSAAPVLLSPGSEFQAGGNPPLAGTATSTLPAKTKHPAKRKSKKARKRKHKKGGSVRRKGKGSKAARRGQR